MRLFRFSSVRRDFYIVELRSVSATGREKLPNWSHPSSLRTLIVSVLGLKTRWEGRLKRSLNVLLGDGGDLIARRDMDVFDDFGAAEGYYARLEKLFSAGPDHNSDWVAHRVFLWAVESSSRREAPYRLDDTSDEARLLAESDYLKSVRR